MTKTSGRPHEPMTLDAGRFGRVDFQWCGDRYQHVWRFPGISNFSPILTSIESGSDAVWPVSPPLQQVHLQSFDDGREVIFGVGMSGRGHWSASFTMVPELKSWIVEFACRSPLIPEKLGCVYQRTGDWSEGPHGWQCDSGLLTMEAIAPTTLATGDQGQFLLGPGTLPASVPSTTQWAYRIKLAMDRAKA